jgi:hypothetical protein
MPTIYGAPIRVLAKAVRHPQQALLRLVFNARLSRYNVERARERLLVLLSSGWQVDAKSLHVEYRESSFARWYRAQTEKLRGYSGPCRQGTSGYFDCESLYLLVRALRPRVVVETGVLYGAGSAHILAALDRNGEGELHSIELGASPGEPPHDFLVPGELKRRWNLIIGDSREKLPELLARLGRIDLFHHDSLHTFEHMTWEYETATPHLSPRGILSSHDVIIAHSLRGIFQENAFPAFCRRNGLNWSTVRNLGLACSPRGQARLQVV